MGVQHVDPVDEVDRVGLDALRSRSTVVSVDANTRRSVINEPGEVDVAAVMDAAVKAQPMAGGSTTPQLVAAVSEAGGIGIVQPAFLAKFRRHAVVGCLIAAAPGWSVRLTS